MGGGRMLKLESDFMKNKEERLQDAMDFRDIQRRKGVIYLPKLPPFMNPNTLRKLLEKYKIERLYLSPEKEHKRQIRIKTGGNRKIKVSLEDFKDIVY
jgi:ESF2/ABP1 family protein